MDDMADTDKAQHPAMALSMDDRTDYAIAVATVAYADGAVDPSEVQRIRALARALELGPPQMAAVLTAANKPNEKHLEEVADRWRHTETSYALLTDAILMAFSDGRVTGAESHVISEFAKLLGIDVAQAVLLGRYVETVLMKQPEGPNDVAHALADGLVHEHDPESMRSLFRAMTESGETK